VDPTSCGTASRSGSVPASSAPSRRTHPRARGGARGSPACRCRDRRGARSSLRSSATSVPPSRSVRSVSSSPSTGPSSPWGAHRARDPAGRAGPRSGGAPATAARRRDPLASSGCCGRRASPVSRGPQASSPGTSSGPERWMPTVVGGTRARARGVLLAVGRHVLVQLATLVALGSPRPGRSSRSRRSSRARSRTGRS
jgi:hypothetical protein